VASKPLGMNEALSGLIEFLRTPSLSTTGQGIADTAAWLAAQARRYGARAEVYATAGHPVVAGEFPGGPRTILLYGHYDVQPPDPLALWESDPFEPVIREGKLYARGATDDKGNLWAALVAASRRPPVTVKFIFEGEEEVGSPNLLPFLREHRELLACDACVLCDRGIHESGRGQIYLGNKGMIHVELRATGPKRDVHSSQAPLLPNPAWRLVDALVRLRDWHPPLPRPTVMGIPFDPAEYMSTYGVDHLPDDPVARLLYEPTCNIQGMGAGYQGPGNKTIIPATAFAKVDIRLVPGQDLHRCAAMIAECLRGVDCSIEATMRPYQAPANHWAVQAAVAAARTVYGGEPVLWPHVDGSGPLGEISDTLGVPAFLIGLGSPFATANTHAPNENLELDAFDKGIAMMEGFFRTCAEG